MTVIWALNALFIVGLLWLAYILIFVLFLWLVVAGIMAVLGPVFKLIS